MAESKTERDQIIAVLTEHEYALAMKRGSICTCGFVPTVDPETLATQQDYHREHIADVLVAALVVPPASEGGA